MNAMNRLLYNTDGTSTAGLPAAEAPAGVPAAEATTPVAESAPAPVQAAPAAPAIDPEWIEVAARMKQDGLTPAQISTALWGKVEEPKPQGQPRQGVSMDDIRAATRLVNAEDRHAEALAAQDTVFVPDIERASGTDDTLKVTLGLVAQGIARKIAGGLRYPANHPLAGQQAPITADVWAKQGKAEFDKAVATIKGSAIRAAAAQPGQPGQLPAGTTQPAKPMDRWNKPVQSFDRAAFDQKLDAARAVYQRQPT